MTIPEIAERLNELSENYEVSELQQYRKDLKNLKKINSYKIFVNRPNFDGYVFHNGGRREFQFNIGFEKEAEIFRFGLAFSLKRSQTLPDIRILFPKIDRFNNYFLNNPSKFSEMFFWYFNKDGRSKTETVRPIGNSLKKDNTFIFIGKYFDKSPDKLSEKDFINMLTTFDELFDVYKFVENDSQIKLTINTKQQKPSEDFSGVFTFKSGHKDGEESSQFTVGNHTVVVDFVHKKIQKYIHKQLVEINGEKNVGTENPSGSGTKIDLVVNKNNKHTFYEIKTSNSIRVCIREALPQLLEYSYWPNKNNASKLIIVSENEITDEAIKYLNKLRNDFNIPVHYQRYNPKKKLLEEKIY